MSERSRQYVMADLPRASAAGQVRAATPPRSRSLCRAGRRQRRRRRVAGLVRFAVFLLLIFVAVWAGVRVAHAGEDARVYSGDQYEVRAGDDLWTIAASHYGDAVDLRKAVYVIRQVNSLEGSTVQPGDDLRLPYLAE